jgi:hypothetical protein
VLSFASHDDTDCGKEFLGTFSSLSIVFCDSLETPSSYDYPESRIDEK